MTRSANTAVDAGPALPPQGHRSRAALVAAMLGLFAMFCGFLALGTWQVERRSWKLALIERVNERVHAAPSAPPPRSQWTNVTAAADEYRHVEVTGEWLAGPSTLVQASTELGSGFWVLTPLREADGSVVLVNRGFIPSDQGIDRARPPPAPAGAVSVTGLLRITEPTGGFLRHNDPAADRWYSRDVPAIAKTRQLASPVAPYFIDADAANGLALPGQPVGGLTVIAFPNSHLVYALTWYGLALFTAYGAWRVLYEEHAGSAGRSSAEQARGHHRDAGD